MDAASDNDVIKSCYFMTKYMSCDMTQEEDFSNIQIQR